MLARKVSCALALLLLVPIVGAFPGEGHPVDILYEADAGPTVLMAGELSLEGVVNNGLLMARATDARIGPATFSVIERNGTEMREVSHAGATLVIHSGGALLTPSSRGFSVSARASYGVAIAFPSAPFGGEESPGFALSTTGMRMTLNATGRGTGILPLDATLSLLDANGRALPGWDHLAANGDHSSSESPESAGETPPFDGVLLHATTTFTADLHAELFAGSSGATGDLKIATQRSEEDAFLEVLGRMKEIGGEKSGASDEGSGAPDLPQLGPFSGVFNGALLIMNVAEGDADSPTPISATIDGEPLGDSGFVLMRGDGLGVSWKGRDMRVQAQAPVVITKNGMAAESIWGVGVFPFVSIFLWAVALAALVTYFVRRPPKGARVWTISITSFIIHFAVLALAFWWWDTQFEASFGTSFLTLFTANWFDQDLLPLAGVLGLELVPWTLASLLFALPVRITLGVAFRYLGKGKGYKGVAKAGGYAALAFIGPFYALWLIGMLVAYVTEFAAP